MEETTITTGTEVKTETTATTEVTVTTTMDGMFRDASKSTEPVIVGEPYVTITSEKMTGVSHAVKWAKITKATVQYSHTLKEAAEKYGSIILTAMGTKVLSDSANIMDGATTTAVTTKMFSFNAVVTANQTIRLNRDCEITDK